MDAASVEVDVAHTFLDERQQDAGVQLEHVVRGAGKDVADHSYEGTALIQHIQPHKVGDVVHVGGKLRQDVPPRMERIDYEIVVDTDEPDRRLELLHDNVKKYGTVFNTVAPGTDLQGVLVRRTSHQP